MTLRVNANPKNKLMEKNHHYFGYKSTPETNTGLYATAKECCTHRQNIILAF